MSRLATVVGALSAIVTLADYLAAKSFLSHWLARQIAHDAAGWRISPTLNLLAIATLVALVWLATDSQTSDPLARKRLFRLRAQLVTAGLLVWFLFGPAIGNLNTSDAAPVATSQSAGGGRATTIARPRRPTGAMPASPVATQGHTSQFTWHRPVQPAVSTGVWKPGDGLRAMARLLESASATPAGRP